ncbi:Acetyltransferase (GNAT) family protein [Roseivivax lentus]|uniref:Acetyltransferase (GNAT) family protein n=1 Tax=Roseivivax lentus TaxID=633194 RepID=A0A1N7N0B2_9RHOB|nr:GNAT family N-acetyltransferase [Roseivivax lentus]SIS91806.1 Acetyltransferase (GNAT) family protein [Roseivivax lentus]
MHLRALRRADAATLSQLAEAAFAPYVEVIGRRPAPMDADYGAAIRRGGGYMVEDARGPAGFCTTRIESGSVWIDTIAVRPDAQAGGLGKRLIAAIEDWAREMGSRDLRLCTNVAMTRNQRLYTAMGFVETHRAEVDGYHRVFYRKTL